MEAEIWKRFLSASLSRAPRLFWRASSTGRWPRAAREVAAAVPASAAARRNAWARPAGKMNPPLPAAANRSGISSHHIAVSVEGELSSQLPFLFLRATHEGGAAVAPVARERGTRGKKGRKGAEASGAEGGVRPHSAGEERRAHGKARARQRIMYLTRRVWGGDAVPLAPHTNFLTHAHAAHCPGGGRGGEYERGWGRRR